MRLDRFLENFKFIKEHNEGTHNFKVGLNQMSDWTVEEYESILTYRSMTEEAYTENLKVLPTDDLKEVDWRLEGKVQEIKDQKSCGSCWAFSSVSALESAHAIAHDELMSFSEQQLVDCSTRNSGCDGGL